MESLDMYMQLFWHVSLNMAIDPCCGFCITLICLGWFKNAKTATMLEMLRLIIFLRFFC